MIPGVERAGNKKEAPRKGRFELAEKFFYGSILKEPGKEFHLMEICLCLLRGFIYVECADRIDLTTVVRAETRVVLTYNPLAASGGLALINLFTHLIQPKPRFRQRVGAAPLAGIELNVL